jgi:subtilisin family serine protease
MTNVRALIPLLTATAAGLTLVAAGGAARAPQTPGAATAIVGYAGPEALAAVLAQPGVALVRRVPRLGAAEVRVRGDVASTLRVARRIAGVAYVERLRTRRSHAEPALAAAPSGQLHEWQYAATRLDAVPPAVQRAAASVTIAIIDTGADLTAPDLAAKAPRGYSIPLRSSDVRDTNGHGTFVASLAGGSVANDEGMAGAGGDAQLLVVQAGRQGGIFTDADEAAAIVYAVDNGAKIVNLSFGGPTTSRTEQRAIDYALSKGVLLVAAVGNEYAQGNPVEYPAALLQPPGSNGVGGRGLAVGASTQAGTRASFSITGSHLSLVAPGEKVLGALSSLSSAVSYPRFALPGSAAGLYGYASGTSFAVPQVAGAAALVWAANPALTAQDVAETLKQSATGKGRWNPETGFGVLDAGAAVARAGGGTVVAADVRLSGARDGRRVNLSWTGAGVTAYRLSLRTNGGADKVLLASTTSTGVSYSLTPGYTYAFRVTGLDAVGTIVSTSAPYTATIVAPARTLKTKKR